MRSGKTIGVQDWASSQSAKVGPASLACGPGSRPPLELSASSGSAGLLTASIFTVSPRLAATSWARSGRYSSRGPAITAGCAPSGSWDRAISTSASATVLAATIWVRIFGR